MKRLQAKLLPLLTLTVLLSSVLGLMLMTATKRVKAAMTYTVASPAVCATNPVVTNNADSGAGSLRQAIADACDGSTITFAGTVVSPITLASELAIDKNLTIQGPAAKALTISGNNAVRVIRIGGGGSPINVTLSDLTIANGQVSADPNGAGIETINAAPTVNIINCTISGNAGLGGPGGGEGGGIFNLATMNIINSTISGNSVSGQNVSGGGGIWNNGTLNVTNTTVSGNSTTSDGGGIFNNGGTVNIKNTIIALNTATQSGPDVRHAFNSQGHNLIGKSDDSSGFTNGVNNDQTGSIASPVDPKLGPLQNNGRPAFTMALLASSPAIDKGDDSVLGAPLSLIADQRGSGFPRKSGTHVDIGAFEVLECTLTCPANITQGNDVDQCGAIVTYPSPTDNGACGTVGCSPESGSFYPEGTTTVTCAPKQDSPVSCSFTITVNDTQAPAIACNNVAAQSATVGASCSATVPDVTALVRAQSTDNCTAANALVITQSPAAASTVSGAGSHPITVSVKDAANNSTDCVVGFTLIDNISPVFTSGCPAAINVAAGASCPISSSTTVSYSVPAASDNCPGVMVSCNPASTSTFPVGTTTVTCTATDASANTAMCSFSVTVFSLCVRDESNPGNVVLVNVTTGAYRFCCNGVLVATGTGMVVTRGCSVTINDNSNNRLVQIAIDGAASRGGAAIRQGGRTLCMITDRNLSNNTCVCQ